MNDIRVLTVTGRVGADAELKTVGQDTKLLAFSLANTVRTKRKGEWVDDTQWVRVAVFGRQAEFLAGKVKRGALVTCSGQPSWSAYAPNGGGEPRVSCDLTVQDVVTALPKTGGGAEGGPPPRGSDDIPF